MLSPTRHQSPQSLVRVEQGGDRYSRAFNNLIIMQGAPDGPDREAHSKPIARCFFSLILFFDLFYVLLGPDPFFINICFLPVHRQAALAANFIRQLIFKHLKQAWELPILCFQGSGSF